jgi:hypothetical protein
MKGTGASMGHAPPPLSQGSFITQAEGKGFQINGGTRRPIIRGGPAFDSARRLIKVAGGGRESARTNSRFGREVSQAVRSFSQVRGRIEGEGEMLNRRWVFLLVSAVVICSVAAGTWYYRSKCHGVDACAAAEAESHERDRPTEPQ